ncbi:ABC transporter ATP-binding protein [Saccharibacillus alkalitolerans]|uniref:ABC transporter ATP-binding protein n=1 Tax=Saccharibacillus alkalitolerans TaxID=2705290 RepID=A0ABX0F340_9BACL|nr:ABC transporter ATP-binding protein [Saccharibacillus alkalitolerans]NGZ74845.1 ABC transporter ATP-binding protein [Saccharibacillus alkalitolerans]
MAAYIRNYKALYTGLSVVSLAKIALSLSIAWFLALVTNAAVYGSEQSWGTLLSIGGAILVGEIIVDYIDQVMRTKASASIRKDLREDTLHHILRLPTRYTDKHHSGEFLSRMTTDNQAVGEAMGTTLFGLISNPLLAIGAFVYLLTISWPMALLCFAMGPVMILIGAMTGKAIRRSAAGQQEAIGEATVYLQDVFGAPSVVKAYGMQRRTFGAFLKRSREILDWEMRSARIQGGSAAGSSFAGNLMFVGAIVVGAYLVKTGSIAVGSMLAFIQLMNYLVMPFTVLPGMWASMQQGMGAADRIFKVIDAPAETEELRENGGASVSLDELKIENMSFSYGTDGENANGSGEETEGKGLRNLNLTAQAGETVALVGESGGGKTTLFKLLLGLYPPQSGRLLLNGKDAEKMDPQHRRSYFAWVPQEAHLFSGTIRDNIADGRPDAGNEEIEWAARMAEAYDFIREFPAGFETKIGERGARLSGGQRQRIAIARALLRDAPVLLLDEATSALDNESERRVQKALDQLKKGRTTFVIAHRLSTIQGADRIIVMEQGRAAEIGTHDELMASKGRYYALYQAQVREEGAEASAVTAS